MASVFDVSGLAEFSTIFVFIFVLVTVFALMRYMKIFGDNELIHAAISFVIAIFVMINPLASKMVEGSLPRFAVLFVFIALVTMAIKMVGGPGTQNQQLNQFFFVILLIAVFVSAGATLRSNIVVPGDNETSVDFERDYSQTSTVVFHPKFIGFLLLFAIAVFTIAILTAKEV